MTRLRAAVLASGGGSNLQALLDHLARLGERRAFDIVLVAADRECGALDRARRAGIAATVHATAKRPDAPPLDVLLGRHRVELVVLAGYLRLVPAAVTGAYAGRIVNVHPGPLPRFGGTGMHGAHVHRAVLGAGVDQSGPTVHLVDEVYDHGAPLAHWPVPVHATDDERELAARVLRAEHLLFPRVVQRLASFLADGREEAPRAVTLPPCDPALDDEALAREVDDALRDSPLTTNAS